MALTVRQAKFVGEYLKLRDGKAAAIAAGYSAKSAAVIASQQLRHPAVRDALLKADRSIDGRLNRLNDLQVNINNAVIGNAEVSVVRTIAETAKLAYFDDPSIGPEQRFDAKVPALRLLSSQLSMIHPPTPTPQAGPIFAINIHLAPRDADVGDSPIDIVRTKGFRYADDMPGTATNGHPNVGQGEDIPVKNIFPAEADTHANGIDYRPEVIPTPERKRE